MARLLSAHTVIDPIVPNSLVAAHPALDEVPGCSMPVKVETLNPIRPFKGRGAELFAATVLKAGETVLCGANLSASLLERLVRPLVVPYCPGSKLPTKSTG